MSAELSPRITLEQAKQLVEQLESNKIEGANQLFDSIAQESATVQQNSELFDEIGKMTRQLHDALNEFNADPRLNELTQTDIPDAKHRLNYVMEMTEKAANRTMDAVDHCLPITDQLTESLQSLQPRWRKLMMERISLADFQSMCHEIDDMLPIVEQQAGEVRGQLTDVLMAQDFQDLTGQVIRRVIELVREVEDSLINILRIFGQGQAALDSTQLLEQGTTETESESDRLARAQVAEGPVVSAVNQSEVVSSQDDVDDLLSSLGF